MAQHDYVIANGSGAAVRSDLNNGLAAIVSQNSGATAPSTTYAYMSWADTTTGVMKMRNGANNAWITLYQLDGEWSTIALENGTAAAPSIYFKDSGTDTGIYSPGADQLAIATGGTGRIYVAANGNCGFNVSNPAFAVDIFASNDAIVRSQTNGNTSAGFIASTNNATNSWFFGSRKDATGGTSGTDRFNLLYDTNNYITVTTTGNIGIKTPSPAFAVDLFASNDAIIRSRTNGNTSAGFIGSTNDGTNNWFFGSRKDGTGGSSGTDRFNLLYDANNYITVTTAGNVGIGMTPAYQLQLSTDSAGKPSTNTWTIVSDERIKEDIELADLSLCYQAVKDIPLKRYKWKDEVYTKDQVHDRRKLGWIAQDVEAFFPKAVRISEFKYNQVFSEANGELISEDVIEDCRNLNADQLYAAMYGAIQMLMVKVEALEATVAALELGA